MVRERLLALLAGAFGILALLLAALGLYGVVAYRVMRRTKEFGIRTALGALPGSIVRMVLRETLVLLILGVSAGLVLALFLGRFVATLLYGIRATDPFSIAAAVLVLITVTMIAGFIPAMRAARVDPLAALRED